LDTRRGKEKSQDKEDAEATAVEVGSTVKFTTARWSKIFKGAMNDIICCTEYLVQCSRRIILLADPQAAQTEKGVQLAPELLPKIREPVLLSEESLLDDSRRPELSNCASTVFGRSLELRLRGFALSALGRQLWRLSSRACM
jgi:hypothetical protein